jgi:hypothetical protein
MADGILYSYASQGFGLLQNSRPLLYKNSLMAKRDAHKGIEFIALAADDLPTKGLVF